jgi:DnaJ-domain-containing protein 1
MANIRADLEAFSSPNTTTVDDLYEAIVRAFYEHAPEKASDLVNEEESWLKLIPGGLRYLLC